MNRNIVLCLALFLLLGCLQHGSAELLWFSNFDDDNVGDAPSGWETGDNTTVTDDPAIENPFLKVGEPHSMKVDGQAIEEKAVRGFGSIGSGIVTVDYWTYSEAGTVANANIHVIPGDEVVPWAEQNCCSSFNGTEGIRVNDGGQWTKVGQAEDEKWYHVRFVIDVGGRIWDLYVDDMETAFLKNIAFRALDDVGGILVSSGRPGVVYIDDIAVFRGPYDKNAFNVGVQSKSKLATTWGRIRSSSN